MPEGTIDGQPYPVATGDRGQTLWETTAARDLPDEIWEDLSLGLGETKRETGRGYLFAKGYDASTRGALRQSPFYHNLNNTALTTAYGYFMETTETTGSTLTIDAFSTGKAELTSLSTLTVSHTVANQSERILIVGISRNKGAPVHSGQNIVKYGGQALTFLQTKAGDSGTNASVHIYYLLDPPHWN